MNSTTLCDKYKAKCFADIKGQDIAIDRIKIFFKNFPGKKALILNGPAGSGKTSLAYSLALESRFEILELNASDLRNSEQIGKIIGSASQQKPLFEKGKILLIDEVDGITTEDRGGLQELIRLIDKTSFPVIITSNNIWDRKFSELRRKAELIEIKQLNYQIVFEILKEISEKENLKLKDNLLKSLAIKSRGDVRAALNDLSSIHSEISHEDIDERDKEENIFEVLNQILQQLPNHETLRLYDKVNMPLDEILLWLEENVPIAYKGEELHKAFEAISRADVFKGRIHRQQYWRFLVYQNFLLSAGISASKKQVKLGFLRYNKPGRILKIWLINQKLQNKKTIAEKYSKFVHIGKKRALRDFFVIKKILQKQEIQKQLNLTEEEISFLREK